MNTKNFIIKTINDSNKFEKILEKCTSLLFNNEKAEESLNYIRNRFSNSLIKNKQFGFFPSSADLDLLSEYEDELLELRLIFKNTNVNHFNTNPLISHYHYHNLIFPIKDNFGYTVGFCGRTFLTEEERKEKQIDKYKYNFFTKTHVLYGLEIAKQAILHKNSVFVVEGQLDCMIMHHFGIYNCVALGGLSFHPYQLYLLRKYGGPNLEINLLFDNDSKGKDAALKYKSQYGNLANIKIINFPDLSIKDVDEHYKKHKNLNFLLVR